MTSPASAHGPTLESLLGFVAISRVQHGDEVLAQLCLRCLVLFDLHPTSPDGFRSVIAEIFGLNISKDRIQSVVDRLISQKTIMRPVSTEEYHISAAAREQVESRIQSALDLQDRVKRTWLNQCVDKFGSDLDGEQAWMCLQQFLSALFRRHGLQTVALLDAREAINNEQSTFLKSSLDEILSDLKCSNDSRHMIEGAIQIFLSTVGSDLDRTRFIVQLADGAFSYYSLSAPPEVAARLQSQLNELTLFLDTNFLFGILGLHINPFDAVSEELISVVNENRLPFKLRYHETTLTEMHRTIVAITSQLKGRHWSQALSRAAVRSPYVSSIERKFHETNAVRTIDPETFFQPLEHPDEILKAKGILIYRHAGERLRERADLINRYQEFLKARHKEKPYEAIDHDMTVLDCVRQQRSVSTSTLDAKGLIITCDTFLFRFDWQELRGEHQLACTVLPNQFLQLLRPFVSASPEFDKSFAESFAIPEFRTVSSASEATRKLLALLTTYQDINEETAASLLANELLLEKLKKSKSDRQFKEVVDAAVIAENAELLEELIATRKESKEERKTLKENVHAELTKREQAERERDELLAIRSQLAEEVTNLSNELDTVKADSASEMGSLRGAVLDANSRASGLEKRLDQFMSSMAVGSAVACSILFVVGAEYLIRRYQWNWLLLHTNSYAIRVAAYLAVATFLLGLFKRSLRKYFWWGAVGCLALVVVVISLLGGPAK